MGLVVNEIIRNMEKGVRYRILWLGNRSEMAYWINMDANTGIPESFALETVEEGIMIGNFQKEDDTDYALLLAEEEIPLINREFRDRIWSLISSAVLNEPAIYNKKERSSILKEIERKTGTKVTNLYVYLFRYWKKGKSKNAFLPEYSKRGAKGHERNSVQKIGRPSKGKSAFGKVLTETDKKNFETAISRYYLKRKELSMQAAYDLMLKEFYSQKVMDDGGNMKLALLPAGEVPSITQLRYWYGKNVEAETAIRKRKGTTAFDLKNRSITGKSDFGIIGPGSKYQIDATVGDIYLVSQFDRSNIIGRPVMYFVIDVFSRIVAGMYIGLEGPSWAGAMMAIANAASDKVEYCKGYDIEIKESEWPCRHVPSAILGDRGELESSNADNLVSMLGVRIENAPPYRADLKGIIEQHFRTINTNAIAFLPGRVKPDMSQRGGHDYRLDARLDIRQFTQVIIKCVLYYNNSHYMDYYERSEQMICDNVEAVPQKLWDWGIANCSGELRCFPEEKIKLALMPTGHATVTARGIRFRNIYYTSQRAVEEAWFEEARSKKSYRIKISYDPRDMSNIYIYDTQTDAYDICTLLDWETRYSEKCLDEIIYEQEKEKLNRNARKAQETEAKMNLNNEIEQIIAEAEEMADTSRRTKAEQVRGIQVNRKEEKSRRKKEEAFVLGVSENEESAYRETEPEAEISPTLKMIKQKLEERRK